MSYYTNAAQIPVMQRDALTSLIAQYGREIEQLRAERDDLRQMVDDHDALRQSIANMNEDLRLIVRAQEVAGARLIAERDELRQKLAELPDNDCQKGNCYCFTLAAQRDELRRQLDDARLELAKVKAEIARMRTIAAYEHIDWDKALEPVFADWPVAEE